MSTATISHAPARVNSLPFVDPRDLVSYSRASRSYVVEVGGQSHTFQAGAGGRQAAYRMAIRSQSPKLAAMIEALIARHPVLEARAWKAAEIVLSGGVTYPDHPGILASVSGQAALYGGDYLVTADRAVLRCDCPDYRDMQAPIINANGQALCKHLIAYMCDRQLRKEGDLQEES